MNRRPQPQQAAQAITELLARQGFVIPAALSLDIVATTEGFTDWAAMTAAIGAGHAVSAPLMFDVGPVVPDTEGPFQLQVGDKYLDRTRQFHSACQIANLTAQDSAISNGRLVRVLNAAGVTVAAYIEANATIHVYSGIWDDETRVPADVAQLMQDTWDEEDVVESQEQLRIHLCDNFERALQADDRAFMGYKHYVREESGRVLDFDPPLIPAFYRQGVFVVNPELPDSLRYSLTRMLPK